MDTVYTVREYEKRDRELIEDFRKQTFIEGNDSLTVEKFDPEKLEGLTLLLFCNDKLASISVCEASHYTNDMTIAARICRFHVLREFRHCNAGFRMIRQQVEWARQTGFKSLYWTNDINKKILNVLYQHERKIGRSGLEEEYEIYKSFKLRNDLLFRVSKKSDFLQYVYEKKLDENFLWLPKENMIYYAHDGKDINVEEVLSIEKQPNVWHFKTSFKKSSIHGIGRFCEEEIKNGEVVCTLGGVLAEKSFKSGFMPMGENTELRCQPTFVNHSCAPNVELKEEKKFVAIKDIMPEEEICIDYSNLKEKDKLVLSRCYCKSENCRNEIFGNKNFIS
jgi:GNAT superfamily N-acetyltransferase